MKTTLLLLLAAAARPLLAADPVEVDFSKNMRVAYVSKSGQKIALKRAAPPNELEFGDRSPEGEGQFFKAKREGTTNRLVFEDRFYKFLDAQAQANAPMPLVFALKTDTLTKLSVTVTKPTPSGTPGGNAGSNLRQTAEPTPTGSMVKDALTLAQLDRGTDKQAAARFRAALKVAYDFEISPENPFKDELKVDDMVSFAGSGVSGGLVSKALGLDVTTLADGLARFFVKRTKQELNTAFFERLRDLLNDDRYRDLRLIFPQTQLTLQAVGDELYNYNAYLTTLRESFEQDLRTLPPHLNAWVDAGTLKPYFDGKPHLKAGLKTSLFFYEELASGTHPGKAIESLPVEEYITDSLSVNGLRVGELTRGFQEISKSLRSGNDAAYWVAADSVRLLLDNGKARKIYLALLFEKVKGFALAPPGRTIAQLVEDWEKRDRFRSLTQFATETRRLEQTLKQARHLRGLDSLAYERYFAFFEQFSRTAEAGHRLLADWTSVTPPSPDSKFTRGVRTLRNLADLGLHVTRRKYGAAVVQTLRLYNLLTEEATDADVARFEQNNAPVNVPVPTHARDVMGNFVRYGSLIAAVAEAETSEEVAAAIEAFALPAGSARIKRESRFNVALNAYTGLLVGHEKILGDQDNWINTFAVSAPIGIAISRGRVFGPTSHGSLTAFLSFIDIGAVTAFRFQNDTTVSPPSIKLKDIISPGLALSYGIGRTPLSVTAGWQAGPLLREVGTASNQTFNTRYSRWYLTLAVDIPLLNFHNRPFVRRKP